MWSLRTQGGVWQCIAAAFADSGVDRRRPRAKRKNPMHWIVRGATRVGLKGADSLFIPNDVTLVEAWEIGARTLGLTASDLAEKIAPAFGLSVADLSKADARALALLPERLARKYHVFPIRDDERHLIVATADPANLEVEHALGFAS